MGKKELVDTLSDIEFDIHRSRIYYEKRMVFWSGLTTFTLVSELVLSSAALVSVLQDCPGLVAGLTAVAAAFGILSLAFKASERAKTCLEQRNHFIDLLKLFPVDLQNGTEELLTTIRDKRLEAEKRDDVLLECVDIVCHNQACDILRREDQKMKLGPIENTLGRFFPIPYKPKPLYPQNNDASIVQGAA